MAIWTIHGVTLNGERIRLDFLDLDGKTAGWIVRRACNVFHAYLPPRVRPNDDGVVDLLRHGQLVGQAANSADARKLVVDALHGLVIEDLDDGIVRLHFAPYRGDHAGA